MPGSCSRCDLIEHCNEHQSSPPGDWFEDALAKDQFTFHFQPIVCLESRSIHAHECLVRLQTDRLVSGGEIISAAVAGGRVHAFDAYCRRKALLSAAAQQGREGKIFLNFLPSSIYNPEHCLQSTFAALEGSSLKPADIVFEVVESEQITSIPHLLKIRDYYRANGFGFALDDCGAGSNTPDMVELFEPEYIKLDKTLTGTTLPAEDERQLDRLLQTADRLKSSVIAEGIEDTEQCARLHSTGVILMQGWYFGRPSPAMDPAAESLLKLLQAVNDSSSPQLAQP